MSSSTSEVFFFTESSSEPKSIVCREEPIFLTPENSCSGRTAARSSTDDYSDSCVTDKIITERSEESTEEDNDDDASSEISSFSCLSGMSGSDWKPISGPIKWIQQQINNGDFSPRELLEQLLPNETISPDCDRMTLFRFLVSLMSQPPMRKRLPDVSSLSDVVDLISRSKKIVVLTGAGVSVSCGIPDFRSRDGIYARLSKEFPTLPDPQAMFDIHYFRRDPRPFFKFAKEIYPGQFEPSPSHKFIKLLEGHGKLLRNYTQNIDTLEQTAGIDKVINCHGSFATASCTRCKFQVKAEDIREDIFEQRIPLCPKCGPDSFEMAVMKPDIVFFGEGLSDEFHEAMTVDKDRCDLLLVMGSSLKVRPVALIPSSIHPKVPQILINREPLDHMNFDVELLGDCDVIVQELANRLGSAFTSICKSNQLLREVTISELESKNSVKESSEATPERSSTDDSMSSSLGSSSMAEDSVPPPDSSFPVLKRTSLADGLPEDSFLFIPPSRYVFKGAEVEDSNDMEDDDDDDSDDQDTSSSSDSSSTSFENKSESTSSKNRSDHHHPVHKTSDVSSNLLIEVPSKWDHSLHDHISNEEANFLVDDTDLI